MSKMVENIDVANLRLECLKLAYSEVLKGNSNIEVAQKLFDWVMLDSQKNIVAEKPAQVANSHRSRRKKAEQGKSVAPADRLKEDLFND